MSERSSAPAPTEPPKQWELRAARRPGGRAGEYLGRDFAAEIIAAAWDLVQQDEQLDFTVKQVVERAGVAVQTFYRHFGTKDELLLAMFEESIRGAAVRFSEGPADPLERLRDLVTVPITTAFDERAQRSMRWRVRERQRLLESFPEDVEAVYEPYRASLAAAIVAVCDAGKGRCDEPDVDATLILHLVLEMAHGVGAGGIGHPPRVVAERVWHMVAGSLAAPGTTPPPPRRPRRRATRR